MSILWTHWNTYTSGGRPAVRNWAADVPDSNVGILAAIEL